MSINKDYVLLIGAEVPFRERTLAGALRASNGADVFTVSNTILSPTLKYFDGHICAKISDHEGVLEQVIKYENDTGTKPLAVIPTNDFTVITAAYVAQYYGLNHNDLNVVMKCRDKLLMRDCLKSANLPIPEYYKVSTLEQLRYAAKKIGYPSILKPRLMAGSLGVIKIANENELVEAFHKSILSVKDLKGEANADESLFLLEEYIDYEFEVSIEVLNTPFYNKAIAVTDKYLGDPPYFVEIGHVVPSRFTSNRCLTSMAEKACEALGITYGISHFEAKINKDGDIKIIEIAARTGGDCIMSLVEKVYNVNPYQLHISSYLNPELNFQPNLNNSSGLAAIAFMKAPLGIISDITIPEIMPNEVVHFNIMAIKGQKVMPLDSWKNREGIIEFYWKNKIQNNDYFMLHINLAKELTKLIFKIKPS